MNTLTDKIRSFDKYALICLITGVIFLILGTVQLVLIIMTPTSFKFDHISVIILDFIIVAFCIVYMVYKSGRLNGILPDSIRENESDQEQDGDSPIDAPSDSSDSSRNSVAQSAGDFIGMGHRISSADNSNVRHRVGTHAYVDESLISPGHRYSPDKDNRQKNVASQQRTPYGSSSHTPNSTQRPRFNSYGING